MPRKSKHGRCWKQSHPGPGTICLSILGSNALEVVFKFLVLFPLASLKCLPNWWMTPHAYYRRWLCIFMEKYSLVDSRVLPDSPSIGTFQGYELTMKNHRINKCVHDVGCLDWPGVLPLSQCNTRVALMQRINKLFDNCSSTHRIKICT